MSEFRLQPWECYRKDIRDKTPDFCATFLWGGKRRALEFVQFQGDCFFRPSGETGAQWNFRLRSHLRDCTVCDANFEQFRAKIRRSFTRNEIDRVFLMTPEMQRELGAKKAWRVAIHAGRDGRIFGDEANASWQFGAASWPFRFDEDLLETHFGAAWSGLGALEIESSRLWAFAQSQWARETSEMRRAARFSVLSEAQRAQELVPFRLGTPEEMRVLIQHILLLCAPIPPQGNVSLTILELKKSPQIAPYYVFKDAQGHYLRQQGAAQVAQSDQNVIEQICALFALHDSPVEGEPAPFLRRYAKRFERGETFTVSEPTGHEKLEAALALREWLTIHLPSEVSWLTKKLKS